MPEPISAGTMLAITALSSLAQAGGMGAQGFFAGQAQEDALNWDKKKWLRDQQRLDEQTTEDKNRFGQTMLRNDAATAAARPNNSIGMLGGLANLGRTMGQGNSSDYLSYLAGR